MRYFACLATIPTRIDGLGPTIHSLLTQTIVPEKIFVFLSENYRRFPGVPTIIPSYFVDLQEKVTICVIEDIGPAGKVFGIHYVDDVKPEDFVLYVDDDRIYAPDLAESYLKAYQELGNKDVVISASGYLFRPGFTSSGRRTEAKFEKKSGYIDVVEGCNGVLVKKRFLDPIFFELLDDSCRYVDDECLSALFAKQRIDCYMTARHDSWRTAFDTVTSLYSEVAQKQRSLQISAAKKRVREFWGIWLETSEETETEHQALPHGIERCSTAFGDLFIWCNDVYIIDSLHQGRVFEEDMILEKLKSLVETSRCIVDIGAHIGCHTLMYSRLNPGATIHSFEAQSSVYECLKRNVAWNRLQNVSTYHLAVGHRSGEARMSSSASDGPNLDKPVQYGFDAPELNLGGMQLGEDGESVSMVTLDSLGLDEVDYIKMDVEGFEPLVLLGAEQTIQRCLPVIVFESNHKQITPQMKSFYNLTTEQANSNSFNILHGWGYLIADLFNGNYLAVHEQSFVVQNQEQA